MQAFNKIPNELAYWDFLRTEGNIVVDQSGNKMNLIATGHPNYSSHSASGGSVALNGEMQWLSTEHPVIQTDQSFSIATWVRLNSDILKDGLTLPVGVNALTAISQDAEQHAGFYLGLRKYSNKSDTSINAVYRWCFALAPVSMNLPGTHVCSCDGLDVNVLDKWVCLVAVCDNINRCIQLHIPELQQVQSTPIQDSWISWNAKQGLQVGRGQWAGEFVDKWPGSIGPTKIFGEAISFAQSEAFYNQYRFKND